jgi:hypothetical protein
LKSMCSMVMGLVGNDVDFDVEYMFQVDISSNFKVMAHMHILYNGR